MRTAYDILNKLEVVLQHYLSELPSTEITVLNTLQKMMTKYIEYPGNEREALKKLHDIGVVLIHAIYKPMPSNIPKDIKSIEKHWLKENPKILSHPDAKLWIDLIATETSYFNYKKSQQSSLTSFSSLLTMKKYSGLFSPYEEILKDALVILIHLSISILARHPRSVKEGRILSLCKNLDVRIILPIQQAFDYRLSDGGCSGYTMIFLKRMLQQQDTIFGIKTKYDSPFNTFSSFRFTNHVAIFDQEINDAYSIFNSFNPKKITAHDKKNNMILQKNSSFVHAKGTKDESIQRELTFKILRILNQHLVADAKQNIGYHITLEKLTFKHGDIPCYSNQHTTAIFPDKTGIHFLDANVGWLHFKSLHQFAIFFERLLKYYEKEEYNCSNIYRYLSTNNLEKKSMVPLVEKKPRSTLFTTIPSKNSRVAGMLDITSSLLRSTLITAEKNFSKSKTILDKKQTILPKRRNSIS